MKPKRPRRTDRPPTEAEYLQKFRDDPMFGVALIEVSAELYAEKEASWTPAQRRANRALVRKFNHETGLLTAQELIHQTAVRMKPHDACNYTLPGSREALREALAAFKVAERMLGYVRKPERAGPLAVIDVNRTLARAALRAIKSGRPLDREKDITDDGRIPLRSRKSPRRGRPSA